MGERKEVMRKLDGLEWTVFWLAATVAITADCAMKREWASTIFFAVFVAWLMFKIVMTWRAR